MIRYFDVHGHINFADYDSDRDQVIKRARDLGVGIIAVGTDSKSSKECVKLAETNEGVFAIIGLHPTHAGESLDFGAFLELARHPKVVAIGECGLDFFHCGPEDISNQKKVFIEHIRLANEVNKPLMLHVRNGKTNIKINDGDSGQHTSIDSPSRRAGASAYIQALEILKEHAKVKADFHFFAGTTEELDFAIQAGCSVSFTGVITFARSYDDVIKRVPIDRIMSETDCPDVAPIPYRGKRNEPVYAIEIVNKIAEIRGEDQEYIREKLLENAKTFFNLVY
jgi:TatD DNase family protein